MQVGPNMLYSYKCAITNSHGFFFQPYYSFASIMFTNILSREFSCVTNVDFFSHMRSFLRRQFVVLSVKAILWFSLHKPLLLVQKVMWYLHPFHSCAWLPYSHHYIFNSMCLIWPINPCKFIVGLIGKCLKFISINNRLEWVSLEVKFLQTD